MGQYGYGRGFTLFEVLIVIGLFTLLGGLALFMSMDSYRGSSFRSDRDLLVSLLQHARARAMNNMCIGTCTDGKPHGVRVEPDRYVVFQGPGYSPSDPENAVFPANPSISRTGMNVVFSQLSATTTATSTTLTGGGRASVISISADGQITWTE